MKPSWNFAKPDLGDRINMCSQFSGYIGHHPIHACQANPPPFLLQLGHVCRTRMDVTSTNPDDEAMEELQSLTADKSKAFRQVQHACKDLQHRHKQRQLRREHQNAGSNASLPEPE